MADSPETTTVYPARRVHTLDRARPHAEAVAVRSGRVLAVGSVDELAAYGPLAVDDSLRDTVVVPGFVEGHSHVLEGGMWAFPYVGFFDRRSPDGQVVRGCQTLSAVLDRLRQADTEMPPGETLVAWGFDPLYFGDLRVGRHELDTVSLTRPVFVFHASAHLASVNTALIESDGVVAGVDGVPVDGEGRPTGELQEMAAMAMARTAFMRIVVALGSREAIERMHLLARNAGVTTFTELGGSTFERPEVADTWLTVGDSPAALARAVAVHNPRAVGLGREDELVEIVKGLAARSTSMVRFGVVKLVLDGSIQGYTARLNWPGYVGGQPNGLYLMPPETLKATVLACHRAGITVHVHCNGDEATDLFIEAVDEAVRDTPWMDHRHTVQHCQLTTPAQYRKMRSLGMCANIFANHIFYWGDLHRTVTVGPDRAARMDACATALAHSIPIGIHSDAAITPIGHLHTMWCAVNRVTASGFVLGPDERISAAEALAAATLGPAYTLRLDHELGSIEPGKWADFTVLHEDPLDVDPMHIRDIGVWGTVVGGRLQPAS